MGPSSASTLVTLALVPLIAWRVVVRWRRARGRQRLSRYRGPISLVLYTTLILALAFANRAYPIHLLGLALALLAGVGLGAFSLARTRFEATSQGLYYEPHAPIGVALFVLLVARLAYRAVEVYVWHPGTPRSWAEFAHGPLTLGAFGLMAGYAGWTALGLMRWRRQVLRRKRAREAAAHAPEERR